MNKNLPDGVRISITHFLVSKDGLEIVVSANHATVLPSMEELQSSAEKMSKDVGKSLDLELRPMTAEEISDYLKRQEEDDE